MDQTVVAGMLPDEMAKHPVVPYVGHFAAGYEPPKVVYGSVIKKPIKIMREVVCPTARISENIKAGKK